MASVIRYSLIKIDTLILLKMSNMPGIEEFTPEFFIQSSEAWMKNKLRRGHSMAYICRAFTQEGTSCKRTALIKDATSEHLCKQHGKYHINKMTKEE
ncbi:hypothetical protein EBV26_16930 [bacterium]|jgi:hypothetical protein|nr:hypothetical protein [bacterium]